MQKTFCDKCKKEVDYCRYPFKVTMEDETKHQFDLCRNCYKELLNNFFNLYTEYVNGKGVK